MAMNDIKDYIYSDLNKRWKYFTFSEFINSVTAASRGIDNSLPPHLIDNAVFQIDNLDSLRRTFHHPIRITSGYRCRELNAAVGGAAKSKHLTAQAVDIQPVHNTKAYRNIIMYILYHSPEFKFNKIIIEPTWLHIEFSPENKRILVR